MQFDWQTVGQKTSALVGESWAVWFSPTADDHYAVSFGELLSSDDRRQQARTLFSGHFYAQNQEEAKQFALDRVTSWLDGLRGLFS